MHRPAGIQDERGTKIEIDVGSAKTYLKKINTVALSQIHLAADIALDTVFSAVALCSWVMILTSQLMLSFIVIVPLSAFIFTTAQLFYPYRFAEPTNPWSVVYHRPMHAFLMKTDFGVFARYAHCWVEPETR